MDNRSASALPADAPVYMTADDENPGEGCLRVAGLLWPLDTYRDKRSDEP